MPRERVYATNAERQKAYRDRKRNVGEANVTQDETPRVTKLTPFMRPVRDDVVSRLFARRAECSD